MTVSERVVKIHASVVIGAGLGGAAGTGLAAKY